MAGYFSAVAKAVGNTASGAANAIAGGAQYVKNTATSTAANLKQKGVNYLAQSTSDKLKAGQAVMTPAEKQHSYDVARQSMLGEFSSSPIKGCQPCLGMAKAWRRQQRLDLLSRSLLACPEHQQQAQRLRQNMDEVETMRCAKHVYLANDPEAPADLRENPPPGFKKATEAQLQTMGLEQDMLTPERSQFRAAVYVKDEAVWGPDPKPAAVLVFRGSTSAKEDWDNNFAQGTNSYAKYYERAVQIGNALAANDASVRIAGHSLGGGLASAAQGGSGLDASTYNAAGLHPETVARYSQDLAHMHAEPTKIAAYRIKGEVLTKTQESLWGSKGISALSVSAVGAKHDLAPAHDEHYFKRYDKVKGNKNDTYDGYLHGMDQVIAATEEQKKADEQVLTECLGKSGKIS